MKALVKIFLSVVISCCSIQALAGSRDAYFILVVDLDDGKSEDSKYLIEDYFNGRFPDYMYDCAVNNGGKFELVYLRSRPRAASNSLINRALSGSYVDLVKLQKVIRDFNDKELKNGFDFLLAYRAVNKGIDLSGVSAGLGQKSIRRHTAVYLEPKSKQAKAAVAAAICELSGAMPFVVAP